MAYEAIIVEIKGAIARVTLNRPDTLNAINQAMINELTTAFTELATNSDVRAVVVTGAGRAFSSGGDIRGMLAAGADATADTVRAMIERVNQMVLALYELPQPVIAAVNGPAHGLGMNLALAADYRIAAMSASFSQAFIKIGLVPDGGGTFLLPRIVGWACAADLMLTGRTVPAGEAKTIGLVHQTVADAEFINAVQLCAQQFAAAPTQAIARTKALLRSSQTADLATQLNAECEHQAACAATADFREGVTAFLEKRPPVFTGR
ncbi:MAG: enoyl-CoA hydratase-related protein [Chloracidobacterium sp.]|nr:enoyl-CoA hydratase-related protein [Chloracidobacterium sp.]MDW8216806.1 enoyl-CoA hydratase-related protein [Acidobacteriota bacterium]